MGKATTETRRQFRESLQRLKTRVAALQQRAGRLKECAGRLAAPSRRRRYAVAERSRCTGCRLCERLCPVGAIRVTYVANIDVRRCTGCGICVQNCPQGAMRLAAAATTLAEESRDA
jgi:ferredoxin